MLAVYLVSYSPRFHSSDGLAMFSMAESLVRRGEPDIDQIRWMGLQQGTYGLDGHLYSRKGAGMALLLAPLTWLGLSVPGWGSATAALLFNSLVTAATAWLLFLTLRRLGYREHVALLGGLVFGLATPAWPYAKTCFSDPLAGFCLLAALLAMLHFRDGGGIPGVFWAGLALSMAVATRYANAAFLPLFAALLLWYAHRRFGGRLLGRSSLLREGRFWCTMAAFAAPLVITAALLVAYNVTRYGGPLSTGYLPEESFSGNWLAGIAGLLVSPGRGLFLYAPLLLLVFPAAPAAIRRHRTEALLAACLVLAHLLLYGKWFMWHGGYAWGPRFMIPTLPFLMIGMAPVIEWAGCSRVWRWAFWVLVVLSALVQVLGLSVHFELFQNRLLETGLPLFAPVTFFDPRYSPLIGQFQFLQPSNLDLAWVEGGRVNWPLLAALGGGVAVTGWALARMSAFQVERRRARVMLVGASLVVIALAGCLLTQVHLRWSEDLRQAVELLNTRSGPDDAIVTGTPDEAEAFADLYRAHARVLGLSVGTLGRDADARVTLQSTVEGHRDVWWLANWLPPGKSDVERWLMENGFRVEDHFFARHEGSTDGRRVARYYFPAALPGARAVDIAFGALIELEKVAMPETTEPGGVVPVTLTWRALQPIEADYSIFVQLLDQAGERLVGADGQPALWMRPTSGWSVGETIEDRHALALPEDIVSGDYRVVAGLYLPNSSSGPRLPAAGGEGFATLGVVHVTARVSL